MIMTIPIQYQYHRPHRHRNHPHHPHHRHHTHHPHRHQAECGDFVEEDYPDHTYLSTFKFVPGQVRQEKNVMVIHYYVRLNYKFDFSSEKENK